MSAHPTRRILGVDFFVGTLDAAVEQTLQTPSPQPLVPSHQLPAPSNQLLVPSSQPPATSHQLPATSYQPPAPSSEPLVPSHQPPATSYQPPATSSQPGCPRAARCSLVVAPSAPGLAVDLVRAPAYRQALQTADLALTDSGFMVLLWRLYTGEKLPRHSGLKFLRAVLARPELKQPAAVFWVMPSSEEARRNQAWLTAQGFPITAADIYIAPAYPATGELNDPALVALIQARRPRIIMLAIGGGVQERLGLALRTQLRATSSDLPAPSHQLLVPSNQLPVTSHQPPATSSELPATSSQLPAPSNQPPAPSHQPPAPSHQLPAPSILCLGAAIAFLTGGQANIPPWADRLVLGWLFRLMSNPSKFWRRYWEALRLAPLIWRWKERTPGLREVR